MGTPCAQRDCTVEQTGICLLNNDSSTCPHRQVAGHSTVGVAGLGPVLQAPPQNARLVPSLTLAADALRVHLGRRLSIQVGVLGFPNAGKTAALVSLYLLVSRGMLTGFSFRESKTLMALEQISRGARRWDTNALPDQVTAHTESADGRTAGFLHLKLFDEQTGKDIDFLVPDLPGEWTTTLANENRTDRLAFLHAASVLWLFVDGRHLASAETRSLAVHRAQLVIQRIALLFGTSPKPPLVLVVTHRDQGAPHRPSVEAILVQGSNVGFSIGSIEVASFSNSADIAAGTGLAELVKTMRTDVIHAQGALTEGRRVGARAVMNFRNK